MNVRALLKLVTLLFVVFIVGYRAYDYFLADNITLQLYTSCDPARQDCFIAQDASEADYEFQTVPYKKIQIVDRYAPACLEEHACDASFSCEGLQTCEETLCSESTIEDGESCVPRIAP